MAQALLAKDVLAVEWDHAARVMTHPRNLLKRADSQWVVWDLVFAIPADRVSAACVIVLAVVTGTLDATDNIPEM